MILLLIAFHMAFSHAPAQAQAAICGLYLLEDFGPGNVQNSITELTPYIGRQIHYNLVGAGPLVQSLIPGQCYCVDGNEAEDPIYQGDRDFRVLFLENITRGPFSGCNGESSPTPH